LFLLARDALQSGLIPPERLFVFSDLSHLHTGLFEPPPPTATAAERVVANLLLPGTYKRRGVNGVYLRSLLTADEGWDPARDLAPLLDFSLAAATRGHCSTNSCSSLADLKAQLVAFLARVAPRLAGTRCHVAFFTHGGFASATAPAAANPHCLGNYAVNGVTSPQEDAENVRDLLECAWLADNLVLPLAKAAAAPGSGGLPGRLVWMQSTCFAPPILRVLAGALHAGEPVAAFGGGGSGGGGGGGGGAGGRLQGASLLLVTHWPLISPVQDVASLWCQGHGETAMYAYVAEQLEKLKAGLAAAANAPAASCALRGFVAPLLLALGRVDSSVGAMVSHFEVRRSLRACVPWWPSASAARQDAAGPVPALVPPLPLTGKDARPARVKKDAQKHQIVFWEPEEEALLKHTPQPLEAAYASAGAAGAKSARDLAGEGAAPGQVLATALLEAARALQKGRLEFGSSSAPPPAGTEEARVLALARAAWLASATQYAPDGAAGDIAHRASANLSVALDCLLATVGACVAGGGGGGGGGGGAPRAPAPWELPPAAARLVSRTLMPLLDSLPLGTALVAHEKSLNEASLLLASARLIAEEADEAGAAGGEAASPLREWVAQVSLAPDLEPPHRVFSDVPLRFRRALAKAAMEVSATRWVGALCTLADVARFVRTDAAGAAAPPAPAADAWVEEARALAAGLSKFIAKFSLGDSSTHSPVLSWLRLLGQGVTLRAFEEALNSAFVLSKTRSPAAAHPAHSPAGGAGGPPLPLLHESYERFLLAAPRSGGVYAWGCDPGEVL